MQKGCNGLHRILLLVPVRSHLQTVLSSLCLGLEIRSANCASLNWVSALQMTGAAREWPVGLKTKAVKHREPQPPPPESSNEPLRRLLQSSSSGTATSRLMRVFWALASLPPAVTSFLFCGLGLLLGFGIYLQCGCRGGDLTSRIHFILASLLLFLVFFVISGFIYLVGLNSVAF